MIQLGRIAFERPAVMGVLNVTPDSFSNGGRFVTLDAAVREAEQMAAAGAAIVDVGGESTRPGAGAIDDQEELDRVIPVIAALASNLDTPISIDTSKPRVMREAIAAGAVLINDVCALGADGAMQAAVELQQPVCLMHMQGEPRTMQEEPHYNNVVADVAEFLADRVGQCVASGLSEDLIMVDPGFGFGKTANHNIELLANLRQLKQLGRPLLIGVSRKSTLGVLTGRDIDQRLPASLAAAVLAVDRGADIVRAHDVGATVDALKVARVIGEADRQQ